MSESDGPIKPKEMQQAEKIYATLRECREQVGLKKTKGRISYSFCVILLKNNSLMAYALL